MTIMVPKDTYFNNRAEKKVYNTIKNAFGNDVLCYHNKKINNHEFDFAILMPELGIVIIEVKSWKAGNIDQIKDGKVIYQKGPVSKVCLNTPFTQAERYKYEFIQRNEFLYNKSFPVYSFVSFPNIDKNEYAKKEMHVLNKDSEPFSNVLLEEEVKETTKFKNKIIDVLIKNISRFNWDSLKIEDIIKIRMNYETSREIEENPLIEDQKYKIKNKMDNKNNPYAIVTYIKKDECCFKEKVKSLLLDWEKGSKIYIITNCTEIQQHVRKSLIAYCKKTKIYKFEDFRMTEEKDFIFNFFIHIVKENHIGSFNIRSDYTCTENIEKLQEISKISDFNFEQFLVEHENANRNIMVKAGAGTGKTFSMVSRFHYLVSNLCIEPSKLSEKFIFITFTNEAANHMREAIKTYYQNLYVLTQNTRYLSIIDAITKIHIGTIHSLLKKIIKYYSSSLGISKDVKIVSGIYETKKLLDIALDEYLNELDQYKSRKFDSYIKDEQVSMYGLKESIIKINDKMSNHNLIFDSTEEIYDLGISEDKVFEDILKRTLPKLQLNLNEELKENDKIALSQLINQVKKLFKNESHNNMLVDLEFMFVDEFQDTDDDQIGLISTLYKQSSFKLFVVGDIKQCIYRFRGAEDAAFERLENNISFQKKFVLNINYRTTKTLLNEYHKIFSKWGREGSLKYNQKDKLKGIIDNCNQDDAISIFNTKKMEKKEFYELFEKIKLLSSKGEKVAFLVRKNSEVNRIANLASENQIFIETSTKGRLFQLQSTIDLYKLLLALQNRYHPKLLFNLFDSFYVNSKLNLLNLINTNTKDELIEIFTSSCKIGLNWNKYVNSLRFNPIMKILHEIISNIKPWNNYANTFRVYKESAAASYKKNLDLLIEKLQKVGNYDYITLNSLVNYLRIMILTKQEEETRSFDDELLNINESPKCLTVHAAKGLEFDLVILPFINNDIKNLKHKDDVFINKGKSTSEVAWKVALSKLSSNNIKVVENNHYDCYLKDEKDSRLSEETRILYVALTRAKKKLVVVDKDKNSNKVTWKSKIKELIDCESANIQKY